MTHGAFALRLVNKHTLSAVLVPVEHTAWQKYLAFQKTHRWPRSRRARVNTHNFAVWDVRRKKVIRRATQSALGTGCRITNVSFRGAYFYEGDAFVVTL